jgi:hypothetical protein
VTLAGIKHLIGLPINEVISTLDGYDWSNLTRPGKLPRIDIAQSDTTDLALLL